MPDVAGAVTYLREEVPGKAFRFDEGDVRQALSTDQQVARLAAQADAFARIGALLRSTTLREAILLIQPDNVPQAAQLTRECALLTAFRGSIEWWQVSAADAAAAYRERGGLWRHGLELLGRNIARRAFTRDEALELADRLLRAMDDLQGYGPQLENDSHLWAGSDTWSVLKDEMLRCAAAFRQFQNEVAPLIDGLPPRAPTTRAVPAISAGASERWIRLLVATPNLTLAQRPDNIWALRLDRYRQVLTGPFAERHILLDQCIRDLTAFALDPDTLQRVGETNLRDFVVALESSAGANARLHARFGRLVLSYTSGNGAPKLNDEAFLAAVQAWEQDANKFVGRPTSSTSMSAPIRERLKPRPNPLAQTAPIADSRPAGTLVPPRKALPLETIAISVKRASGETMPLKRDKNRSAPAWVDISGPPLGLVNADGFDVYWNHWSILVERQPAIWEEIYFKPQTEHAGILDVAYDGQNIWAITCCQGVFMLSAEGRIITTRTPADGLPTAENGAKLAPLSPGRVLAVGSLGRDFRGWCATLTLKGDAISTDVFHEATSVFDQVDRQTQDSNDPKATFVPAWIYCVREPGRSGPPSFLLVRDVKERVRSYVPVATLPLLRIDADQRTVEPVLYKGSWSTPYFDAPNLAFLDDGTCVSVTSSEIVTISHPASANGSARRFICRPNDGEFSATLYNIIIPFEGQLYFPGLKWLRFDPSNGSMEAIGDGMSGHYVGVSRWHQLVAWNDEGEFRSVLGVQRGGLPGAPGYDTAEQAAEILAKLDRDIQASPQDSQPWYGKVRYLYQAGRLGDARAVCEAWIEAQPHKMEPRYAWRVVVLKSRFGLDIYQDDVRVEKGTFASFAEWLLYNDPGQNSRSAGQLRDAVHLPITTNEAEWPLAELGLYDAVFYKYYCEQDHVVVEICDIWEKAAQEHGGGTDFSYLALRAAARLRLGQLDAARKDAAAAVEKEKAGALWSGNAQDLLHAIERGESGFQYRFAQTPDLTGAWGHLRKR